MRRLYVRFVFGPVFPIIPGWGMGGGRVVEYFALNLIQSFSASKALWYSFMKKCAAPFLEYA